MTTVREGLSRAKFAVHLRSSIFGGFGEFARESENQTVGTSAFRKEESVPPLGSQG